MKALYPSAWLSRGGNIQFELSVQLILRLIYSAHESGAAPKRIPLLLESPRLSLTQLALRFSVSQFPLGRPSSVNLVFCREPSSQRVTLLVLVC